MITVGENIKGKHYRRLMEFVFSHSDAVMMVYQPHCGVDMTYVYEVREKLRPNMIYTRSDADIVHSGRLFEWPGDSRPYQRACIPSDGWPYPDYITHADTYALTAQVKEFILSVDGIFNWQAGVNPEDVAFFKNGFCWFYTIVHESSLCMNDHEGQIAGMLDEMHVYNYSCHDEGSMRRMRFYEPYPQNVQV